MKYLLLALLAMAAAPAADAQPESAYYGLSLGEFDYEESAFDGSELIADTVSSYRLMVGYQFLEHLGVEGGYGETSTIRESLPGFDFFTGIARNIDVRTDFKILTIRLLGILPFDNGVSLLGGISYADLKQDATRSIEGLGEQSVDFDRNEPAYYVGAQYDWDRVAVRLAFEKYDFDAGLFTDDVDVSETSLTFFYKL